MVHGKTKWVMNSKILVSSVVMNRNGLSNSHFDHCGHNGSFLLNEHDLVVIGLIRF